MAATEDSALREIGRTRSHSNVTEARDDASISVSTPSSDACMDDVNADSNPDPDTERQASQQDVVDGDAGLENFAPAASGSQGEAGNFPGLPASIIRTPTDLDFLDLNFNAHDSAWLLGSNFDIAALNDTIATAIPGWGSRNPGTTYATDRMHDVGNNAAQLNSAHAPFQPLSSVQQNWHTRISQGGQPSADTDALSSSDKGHIDEAYRTALCHRLHPPIDDHALPSADFLVSRRCFHRSSRRNN